MEGKAIVSDRLDSLDSERFGAMVDSPAFDLLKHRFEQELERARADCEVQTDLRDIHRAQGAVRALRAVLALPATIQREIDRGNIQSASVPRRV